MTTTKQRQERENIIKEEFRAEIERKPTREGKKEKPEEVKNREEKKT